MAYVLKSRLVTDLIPAYAKPLTTPSFSPRTPNPQTG